MMKKWTMQGERVLTSVSTRWMTRNCSEGDIWELCSIGLQLLPAEVQKASFLSFFQLHTRLTA